MASCLHAEHALITSLTAREDIHTIPVDEVGQTVNVSVALRVKKIIELVKHDNENTYLLTYLLTTISELLLGLDDLYIQT